MNIKAFAHTLTIAVSASLSACTAPIDIDTRRSEPVIVVYGELSDRHGYQRVSISSSADYFTDKPAPQPYGAEVWIESDGQRWPLSQSPLLGEEDIYITDEVVAAAPGSTYALHIELDFDGNGTQEKYTAVSKALRPVIFDSIELVPQRTFGINTYHLLIYGQEPPEKNFYIFQLLVNDVATRTITDYRYMDDRAINDSYLDRYLFGMYLSREHENMIPSEERENTVLLGPGDKVTLRILNVEEGYYNFISQCNAERRGNNPFFGGPYSNIESNILPTGAGYFVSYCLSELSTVVPADPADN